MTFLELQNQVLTWLDEVDDTDVTRTVVKQALNAANRQRSLEQDWAFMLADPPVYTSWTVDERNYELPNDCRRVQRLYNVTKQFDYTEVPFRALAGRLPSATNGEETSFYVRGEAPRTIVLFSPPTTADEVELHYYKRPTSMTDDADTPDLPEDYHDLLVWDALLMMKAYHTDADALALWKEQQTLMHDALIWDYGMGAHTLAGETSYIRYIP